MTLAVFGFFSGILGHSWIFQELGDLGMASDPDPRDVLEWKIRNCRELLRLFRLTGNGKSGNFGEFFQNFLRIFPGISRKLWIQFLNFSLGFSGFFLEFSWIQFLEFSRCNSENFPGILRNFPQESAGNAASNSQKFPD